MGEKSNNKLVCKGINYKRNACDRIVYDDVEYCDTHKYFEELSREIINGIKDSSNDYKVCGRCKRWHNNNLARCKKCTDESKEYKEKVKTVIAKSKCIGPCVDNKKCVRSQINETKFCDTHAYMKDYTMDMLKNVTPCSGCRKMFYKPGNNTCEKCRNRSNDVRTFSKKVFIEQMDQIDDSDDDVVIKVVNDKKKMIHKCNECAKNDPDKYVKGSTNVGNKWFCGKHQTCAFKEQTELNGKKVCSDYIRGCRVVLDKDYAYVKCDDCRQKERVSDKKLRDKKHEMANETKNDDNPFCPGCSKKYPQIDFFGENGRHYKRCYACRQKDYDNDKREKRVRDYSEYEARPEVKIRRKNYKINNPEKCKAYTDKYKLKLIEKMGKEEVNKMIAERTRKYRKSHPEIMNKIYDKVKKNPKHRYKYYVRSAKERSIEWSLSYDDCVEYFDKKCYYCREKYVIGGHLLGIDRLDNSDGYFKENCVTCCEICNMIKCEWQEECLYSRVIHILSNLFITNDFYSNFNITHDSMSLTYNNFTKSCVGRKKTNNLTENEFGVIKSFPCYLCGKENSKNHINGIDRIDNSKGYCVGNCLACCKDCNYMKREYKLEDFILKLCDIYEIIGGTILLSNDIVLAITRSIVRVKLNETREKINKL